MKSGSIISKIELHVQPNAKKTEIAGLHGDRLKIRVHAPPVDDAANDEILRFFSDLLNLSLSSVEISSGKKSKQKTLQIECERKLSISDFLP